MLHFLMNLHKILGIAYKVVAGILTVMGTKYVFNPPMAKSH